LGAQFGMAEATLVLAALVQSFRIALADDQEVMPKPIVTTQPDRGACLPAHASLTDGSFPRSILRTGKPAMSLGVAS